MTKLYFLALGCCVLAGCVRTSTVRLGDPVPYPPVDPSEVVIFITEGDVPGPFVKVAYISAEGAHGFTTEKGMVEKVQREAAKLGANGVVVNEIAEPSAGAKIAASVFGTTAQRTGKMLAIRYGANRASQVNRVPAVGDYKLPVSTSVYPVMSLTVEPAVALPVGTVVTVVSRQAAWALVRYAMGKQGYLHIPHVEPVPPPTTPQPTPTAGPCADSLYQELKKKDVNKMTEREFAIFQERDRACAVYQRGGRDESAPSRSRRYTTYRRFRSARARRITRRSNCAALRTACSAGC
jgi:hypothetical protein